MWHFCPDLTFTQVDRLSAFDFDGNRAAVSLSPLLYLQAHSPAAVSAWRSQSKFKVFSDAQGKTRDDLFHQQRAAYRLLLNIPPTVMLCSQSWPGCTTYEMGFPFVVLLLLLLILRIGIIVWFSPVPQLCLYFHLWQDTCSCVTWQSAQCQAAKHWTTNPTNPFPCAKIISTTRFQECGWLSDCLCLAMEIKNVDVQMFLVTK